LRGVNFFRTTGESCRDGVASRLRQSTCSKHDRGLASATRVAVLVDVTSSLQCPLRTHQAKPPPHQNRFRFHTLQSAAHYDGERQYLHRNNIFPLRGFETKKKRPLVSTPVTKLLGLECRESQAILNVRAGEPQRFANAPPALTNAKNSPRPTSQTGNLDTKNSDVVLEMLRQLNKSSDRRL